MNRYVISVFLVLGVGTVVNAEPIFENPCLMKTCFKPGDRATRSYFREYCDQVAGDFGYQAGTLVPESPNIDPNIQCTYAPTVCDEEPLGELTNYYCFGH